MLLPLALGSVPLSGTSRFSEGADIPLALGRVSERADIPLALGRVSERADIQLNNIFLFIIFKLTKFNF